MLISYTLTIILTHPTNLEGIQGRLGKFGMHCTPALRREEHTEPSFSFEANKKTSSNRRNSSFLFLRILQISAESIPVY